MHYTDSKWFSNLFIISQCTTLEHRADVSDGFFQFLHH